MKLAGYSDHGLEDFLTVAVVSKLTGLAPNTVRKLIDEGKLPAARVGREVRVGRDVFLSAVAEWRKATYRLAALSVLEFRAALEVAARLARIDVDALVAGWDMLEDLNYVTMTPDGGDCQILVAPTPPDPREAMAGIVRRLLLDEHYVMTCPWCGAGLPRLVHAASGPRPRSIWTLDGVAEVRSPETMTFAVGAWSIQCSGCEEKRYFLTVMKPSKSKLAYLAADAALNGTWKSGTEGAPSANAFSYVRLLETRPEEAAIEGRLSGLRGELGPLVAVIAGRDEEGMGMLRSKVVEELRRTVGPSRKGSDVNLVLGYVIQALGGALAEWQQAWREQVGA